MTTLRFEQLDPIKLPLIKRFYKQHYPSKPKSDECIITAYSDTSLVGVVRFRPVGQHRLLTGMVISPHFRGQGFATQLLNYCQKNHLTDHDYCFAYTHLQNLYLQHRFSLIEQAELPQNLKDLFERYTSSGKSLLPMQYID
ncbi:GNAT family N-acetyltransferase [Vibrio tapetis subsp. quintayensis]|uniref:GNAT family N-acetyltransferase n=1 Tax=Vibrio tapetis TaxID=52443 RepID=UPI0025B4C0AB|nr:GNAT family N-acetyltransferase [Vibrio tapetis]MDN3678833.1 GNAT family N-acetyltransferase [Vibrio tapetis subsp. quintayensis]